jgi:lipoyl-dependent peroxiredoxin subunit D
MSSPISNEAVQNLIAEFGIDANHSTPALVAMAAGNSRYLKELKLNVSAVLGSTNMSRKDTAILALAAAANQKHDLLCGAFERLSIKEGANESEIGEVYACVSLMNVNNVVYRFRHFMHQNEYYNNHPLGLRMGLMLNPVLGKPLFELMSLMISALNGCEQCVTSHENSVRAHGVSEAAVYDCIRLGGVIRGLCEVM